jgi:hypothetical protein
MLSNDGEQMSEKVPNPPELHEELDDISAGVLGVLPEFRGRSVQPDGGGSAAHC